ncbi:MAG: hypothetical protein GVY35_04270 [Bacteroidetes bacterium]|jgi:hypothetical protein|nr:hypothetical protein [Bacteroidota bacterium]
MDDLIRELIPHAPQLGLYVAPNVPAEKRRNALSDYGDGMGPDEVMALYDATLTGNAKDGALLAADRLIFQNTDLEAAQTVRYRDLVGVTSKRRLLGGRKVVLDVNRGRATFQLTMDFSGSGEAAQYVTRFLEEAMHRSARADMASAAPDTEGDEPAATDVEAVRAALDELRAAGQLTKADYHRLLQALGADRGA